MLVKITQSKVKNNYKMVLKLWQASNKSLWKPIKKLMKKKAIKQWIQVRNVKRKDQAQLKGSRNWNKDRFQKEYQNNYGMLK